MKRILALLLLTLLTCAGCGKKEVIKEELDIIKDRGEIIIGVREDVKPFGFRQNDELVGYEIDLANIIGENLDVDVKLVPIAGQERIIKLESGDVDIVIATMSVTPNRQMLLEFSVPYYFAGQTLMTTQGRKETTLKEFDKKKIIMVFGSTSEIYLKQNLPNAELIGYRTYNEAYDALKQGHADVMLADDAILFGLASNDPSMKILQKRYSREPYAIAFRRHVENEKLITRINSIIKDLQDSGELAELQKKWDIKR